MVANQERDPIRDCEMGTRTVLLQRGLYGVVFQHCQRAGILHVFRCRRYRHNGQHRLHVTISSARYSLIQRDWDFLEDRAVSATADKPTDFAYFAQRIRLYPIPDGAYVVSLSGNGRLTALSADADTNGWTQDGFDLIKAEAKLILASEYLHDAGLAAAMVAAIYGAPAAEGMPPSEGILAMLRKETALRSKTGITRANR
jgi:hypothetical protein